MLANNALSALKTTHRPDPLDCFRLRTWARAYLFSIGDLSLHEAVDELQEWANELGFIDELGQDRIQSLMAAEFGAVR